MATVLVLEDDDQVRVLAKSIAEAAGHTVLSAAGGLGAEALLNSPRPIDVLFIDIVLGHDAEAGIHVARHAARRRPGLKVIYTTGKGMTGGMRSQLVESSHFLPKPYTVRQLTSALALANA